MLSIYYQTVLTEAGVDEAGRGPLVGPVTAAAVMLPPDFRDPMLRDSKKLSERQRERLRGLIEREAIAWAVFSVGPERIDEINILNATFEAMEGAVLALFEQPGFLVIDGNRFKPTRIEIPYVTVVKGDDRFLHVAAASILAKTYRDEYMLSIAARYPEYDWSQNKGYPTAAHVRAIREHGLTEHHRRSFKCL